MSSALATLVPVLMIFWIGALIVCLGLCRTAKRTDTEIALNKAVERGPMPLA